MARCKLTNMNLRNIRKSREYQCILIDLVSAGVVEQSEAEELLGYTIPAGLLENPVTPDDDDDEGDDDDDDDGGNSDDPGEDDDPGEAQEPITLLYFDATANDNAGAWLTESYDLDDGATDDAIVAAAKTLFEDDSINACETVEANPEYVEGTTPLEQEFIPLDPQPETLEPGQFVKCYTFVPVPVNN